FLLRLERQAESIIDPDHTGPPAHAATTSAVAAGHQAYLPPPPAVTPPSSLAGESSPPLADAPAMDLGGNGHAVPVGGRVG
ncbi:MAG: hypothetical protein ABJB47_14380, partial [Actinomycetota bacterium]